MWQQKKLIEFCKANNIIVTAYSPLGAKGTSWGTNDVMDNQVLKDIALARRKTVAQVILTTSLFSLFFNVKLNFPFSK